jgi:hypothetical protein
MHEEKPTTFLIVILSPKALHEHTSSNSLVEKISKTLLINTGTSEATEATFVAGFEIGSKVRSVALILSLFESGAICWEFITPDSDTAVRNFCCFTISDARLELLTSNGVEQQHATHTNDPGDDGKGWKQYTSKLWRAFL